MQNSDGKNRWKQNKPKRFEPKSRMCPNQLEDLEVQVCQLNGNSLLGLPRPTIKKKKRRRADRTPLASMKIRQSKKDLYLRVNPQTYNQFPIRQR